MSPFQLIEFRNLILRILTLGKGSRGRSSSSSSSDSISTSPFERAVAPPLDEFWLNPLSLQDNGPLLWPLESVNSIIESGISTYDLSSFFRLDLRMLGAESMLGPNLRPTCTFSTSTATLIGPCFKISAKLLSLPEEKTADDPTNIYVYAYSTCAREDRRFFLAWIAL